MSLFQITSEAEDPIQDTIDTFKELWVRLGRPNISKIVNSIEINGEQYEFLMMNSNDGVEVIIK